MSPRLCIVTFVTSGNINNERQDISPPIANATMMDIRSYDKDESISEILRSKNISVQLCFKVCRGNSKEESIKIRWQVNTTVIETCGKSKELDSRMP